MSNLTTKMKSYFKGWKWILIIPVIFLASADAFTMAAPYYIRNIFPNVQDFLGIDPSDLSICMSILGITTLVSQLPGGWLADKISSKKMFIVSLFITGVLTIVWSLVPFIINQDTKLLVLYLIYFGWGVSTTLIFWTPLWKLLSQQGEKDEQGQVYGLQGSINGAIGFGLIFMVGLAATTWGIKEIGANNVPIGFSIYAAYMGLMLFGTAFGVMVFVKERPTEEKFSVNMSVMGKVLTNYKIWLLGFFIMGIYMLQTSLTFMTNYMANVLLIGAFLVSIVGAFRTYLARMIISSPTGKFADKRRSFIEILLYAFGLGIILLIFVAVLPGFSGVMPESDGYILFMKISTIAVVIVIGFLCWIMVTIRYTSIIEIKTPKNSHATVVGVISLIAFSTDSWFYPIAAVIQGNYSEEVIVGSDTVTHTTLLGNQLIFLTIAAISIFGFICGLILFSINLYEHRKHGIPFKKELNNTEASNETSKMKQTDKNNILSVEFNSKEYNSSKNNHLYIAKEIQTRFSKRGI